MIERQLKWSDSSVPPTGTCSPTHPPGPSESPTITSILKDSQRNYAVSVGRGSGGMPVRSAASTPPARQVLPPDVKQQVIIIEPPSLVNINQNVVIVIC